jgi:hypothetical protein
MRVVLMGVVNLEATERKDVVEDEVMDEGGF